MFDTLSLMTLSFVVVAVLCLGSIIYNFIQSEQILTLKNKLRGIDGKLYRATDLPDGTYFRNNLIQWVIYTARGEKHYPVIDSDANFKQYLPERFTVKGGVIVYE